MGSHLAAWTGRCRCGVARLRSASGAAGSAVDHELIGRGGETVDGRLGEELVGHDRQPLDRVAVGGDHRGCLAVALDLELVDLRGVDRVHGGERVVIEDQEVDADQLAHLGVVAGVEPRGLQALEELVGALEVDADAPAHGDGRARWP